MTERVTIYEVGLRDGLQNEKTLVSTADKSAWLSELVKAGLRTVELTSFVSPKAVPQMADASDMVQAARAHRDLRTTALVINEKGYRRAQAAGATGIALVVVLTETLSQKNSRMSVEDAVSQAVHILDLARQDGLFRRVYLAPAWVDPYEGSVSPDHVLSIADKIISAEPEQIALADTIGHAEPRQVEALCTRLAQQYNIERLAAHLHDTQGLGITNAYAALQAGIRTIDASFGGLGGCPFAPGSAGNLATEDLVLLADKLGFKTGVDLEALWTLIEAAEAKIDRPLGGRTRAWHRSRQRRT